MKWLSSKLVPARLGINLSPPVGVLFLFGVRPAPTKENQKIKIFSSKFCSNIDLLGDLLPGVFFPSLSGVLLRFDVFANWLYDKDNESSFDEAFIELFAVDFDDISSFFCHRGGGPRVSSLSNVRRLFMSFRCENWDIFSGNCICLVFGWVQRSK